MELLTKSDIERFFAKIDIPYDNMLLGCWEWKGCKNSCGYGQFSIKHKNYRANRISYLIFNKKFPDNFACHTCDNRSCINPLHLWDGTPQENITDMMEKGRHKYDKEFIKGDCIGSKNLNSKLTEEQVIDIRSRDCSKYGSQVKVAKQFNITKDAIHKIIKRITWTHI